MADKPRKPPQPRGLTVEIPLDHTQRALQLAAGAGLQTKADVEEALAKFILEKYLEPFLAHLGAMAIARVKHLLGSSTEAAAIAEHFGATGLNKDGGGIPLAGSSES